MGCEKGSACCRSKPGSAIETEVERGGESENDCGHKEDLGGEKGCCEERGLDPNVSGKRYLAYQHESAYLLAKGRPPEPSGALADVIEWRDFPVNELLPTEKPWTPSPVQARRWWPPKRWARLYWYRIRCRIPR